MKSPNVGVRVPGTSPYIQCGLCGHRHPVERARARGYIECACGLRLQLPPEVKRRGRKRTLVLSLLVALVIGGAMYWLYRGMG